MKADYERAVNGLGVLFENGKLELLTEKKNRKQLRIDLKNQSRALELIQLMAQEIQEKAHLRISSVVTKCLSIVFDEPYEFNIIFERKRNKTEARLVFLRDGNEIDPLSSSGGGVVDVAAFALRMACMMLRVPSVNKIVVLDEPFRFVSAVYQENTKEMIVYLSEKLNIQFIYVTHNQELVAGNVIEIQ